MRRLLSLVVSSIVLGLGAPAAVASADPIGSCTSSTGTIIAVDYRHWGGPVVRGCGLHAATGAALLDDGGFTHVGTTHDGPAFICRIGNAAFRSGTQYPTAQDEACNNTPPASAYWSYWLAAKGQNSWTYSQLGAYSEKPKQGEVELWQFGGTNIAGTQGRPTISPDALRAKNTTSTGGSGSTRTSAAAGKTSRSPTPRAAATQAGAAGRSTAAPAGTHPTGAAASSANASARSTTAATATSGTAHGSVPPSGPTASATSGAPSGSPSIVDASAVARSSSGSSSGSALPVVLGVALVLLLGAGGGWGVLRRRRADSAEH